MMDTSRWATHKDQGSVEVLIIFLDIVGVVLGCLLLVYRVEIETGIVVFDGLEECSEGILETAPSQRPATQAVHRVERTTSDRFVVAGILRHPF